MSAALLAQSGRQESPRRQSSYVQRMMSLDKNKDGALSGEELPGGLVQLLTTHDANNDGQLDGVELAKVESEARSSRHSAEAARQNHPPPRASRPLQRDAGSPLDHRQILRFALRFDDDQDGGLNERELINYAKALAVRRAQNQRMRITQPATQRNERPRGLGGSAEDDPQNPFKR